MIQKHILAVVAIAGAVIVLGGIFFLFVVQPNVVRAPTETANSTPRSDEQVQNPGNQGYTITQLPVDDIRSQMPDLSRDIVFDNSIPTEVQMSLTEKARSLKAVLTDDPTRTDLWFNLAIVYHSANDYDGARAVWEFLIKVVPEDTTSYDNLGKLYHFSLHDYPKAESYFNQSLAVNPNLMTPYLELFELYRYSYKTDTTKAADIIHKAIAKFPGTLDFHVLLGDYYRDRGDVVKAKAEYLTAMDLARKAGDVSRINAIGESILKLPQ